MAARSVRPRVVATIDLGGRRKVHQRRPERERVAATYVARLRRARGKPSGPYVYIMTIMYT